MSDDGWDFSDDDLDQLFQADDAEGDADDGEEEEEVAFSEADTFSEIGDMCRRIAVQYVDIIASFAALTFRNKGNQSAREAVTAAATALLRLAEASHDTDLIPLARELQTISTREVAGRAANARQRRALTQWLSGFIEYLPASEQDSLRRIIEYDFQTQPLLRELSDIRGIGARRLQSLYTAGLFEVQVLSIAKPEEITAATGIPLRLAEEVVQTAVEYARVHRKRTVESLRRMVAELARSIRNKGIDPSEDQQLIRMAQESLSELQTILQDGKAQ